MSRAVQHVLNISCFNGLTNHSSLFQTWHSSSQWQESTSISEAAWGGKNESELNSLSCSQTKEYGQASLGSAISTPNDSPHIFIQQVCCALRVDQLCCGDSTAKRQLFVCWKEISSNYVPLVWTQKPRNLANKGCMVRETFIAAAAALI